MEEALDELLAAIGSGADFVDSFRRARRLAAEHYREENALFRELAQHLPGPADKMTEEDFVVTVVHGCSWNMLATAAKVSTVKIQRRVVNFHVPGLMITRLTSSLRLARWPDKIPPLMSRPITLFTGQWADLPLAELLP